MKKRLEDYVMKFQGFLDKKFCDETIKEFKKSKWEDHYFNDSRTNENIKRSGNQELEVSFQQIPNKKIIMDKLFTAIGEYQKNLNFDWWDTWNGYSEVRFNRYTKTKKMALHCDHIHTIFDGERKGVPILSCLGGLNDNYTGGELVLFGDTIVELKQGELIIFPSSFLYPHKVKPVKKGTRYSYISWVW
jgi:predicted 2-oxoglutarate/Fe(II)-dependent dioxygenase YbiX|tara:strand:+ start:5437 stop:6003 length:567 start_codon:yes stop_codon:yes gene_type:complete